MKGRYGLMSRENQEMNHDHSLNPGNKDYLALLSLIELDLLVSKYLI
jgi:hypothetical protein